MLLICAATAGELAACSGTCLPDAHRFVSGVGIPATFVSFWNYFEDCQQSDRPNGILNIGIAGAYPDMGIAIGDIILAESDLYGDVGMELADEEGDEGGFLPMSTMTYGKAFYGAPLSANVPDAVASTVGLGEGFTVHLGRGCTVNTCTGTEMVGRRRAKQTGAVFETMEGAVVLQVGQTLDIPVCQIRAISNIASQRDMRPENIRLALENLGRYLGGLGENFTIGTR